MFLTYHFQKDLSACNRHEKRMTLRHIYYKELQSEREEASTMLPGGQNRESSEPSLLKSTFDAE